MQRLGLTQSLSQKLSPQQIQFIKLLQVPTAELDTRIEEELEVNPALEEGKEEEFQQQADDDIQDFGDETAKDNSDEINVEDYIRDEDYSGYKMQGDGNIEERDMPLATSSSLNDSLLSQLGFIGLDEHQTAIGKQLIGSIDNDGYIRRDLEAIINDLAFSLNIETDFEEVESILKKIQKFDPPGIAAHDLKECLYIQLSLKKQQTPDVLLALRILNECFNEFTKKHYEKIMKKLEVESEDILNPRPTLPDQVAAYDDFRRQRLLVRPGVTGLAQVYSSAEVSWDERILYDIAYVRACSLRLDLAVLLRTIAVVIAGEARTQKPFNETRYTPYVAPPPDFGSFTARGTWERPEGEKR